MAKESRAEILLKRLAEEKAAKKARAAARKKGPGGKRPNAGRRRDYFKKLGAMPFSTAHEILSNFDVIRIWGDLLNDKSGDVRLKTLVYLYDRAYGKMADHLITASANAIEISFRGVSDNDLQAKLTEIYNKLDVVPKPALEAPPVIEAAPEPTPEPAPPPYSAGGPTSLPEVLLPHPPRPPTAVVNGIPGVQCLKHGMFWPTPKVTTCPACIEDGERDAARMASLMPGALGN